MVGQPEGRARGAAAVGDRGSTLDLSRRLSVLLAIRGVLALIFGVLVLVWPGITVLALAFAFAAYVIVDGIGMVASGLGDGHRARWAHVLAGVLAILVGIVAAVLPGVTALVLVLLVGAWAVVTGVLEVAAAFRHSPGARRWTSALVGVLSVIAGVIILARPGVGALALATVLGVYALLAGLSLLWAAWQLRKVHVLDQEP